MPNIFDYLNWRGDLTFDKAEPNEIDALIFSELSYIPFDRIVNGFDGTPITLKDASREFFARHGEHFSLGAILPSDILVLFKRTAESARFSNVLLWGYKSETCIDVEKQFSAICFSCDDKLTYVAYRGTDDTIIGWKEDLNMSLFTPIPSQKDGVEYLEQACKKTHDKIIVTGHSKGGNIAVYSALNCSEKHYKRIQAVYSFDGPGFMEEYISAYKEREIVSKIKTILPSKSVVGRIFDIVGDYKIIKSSNKGVQQHDAFTWQTLGTSFVSATCFEKPSDNFHDLLKAWVSKMPMEDRHEFVDSFYKMATSSDASTLTDINNKKFKFILGLIKSEGSNKKVLFDAVFKLIKEQNVLTASKRAEAKKKKIALKSAKKEAIKSKKTKQ